MSRILSLKASSLVVLGVVLQPNLYGQATITGSFKGSTEPGWVVTGNAKLTSGVEDPAGNGWLRLTANAPNQSSFVYYDTGFPLASGFRAVFNYASWGSGTNGPGDGIAFVLFDANEPSPRPGAFGGSLGYAQKRAGAAPWITTDAPGLPSAVLGVGLDSFGWFATSFEGRVNGPGARPFAVTIRGPGDGTAAAATSTVPPKPNYDFLITSGTQPQSYFDLGATSQRPQNPADMRQAIITVDTSQILSGRIPTTVDLVAGTSSSVRVIDTDLYPQLVAYYGSAANFPAAVKFGFSGGTGDLVQYQDIRLVTVEITNTPLPDLQITKTHAGNFQRGSTGVYSLSVRNAGSVTTSGEVVVTDTLPAGLTPTAASGDGWTCGVTLQTVTCSTTTPLPASQAYPSITLNVNVLATAPDSVTNIGSVVGGGDTTPATASDPTNITGTLPDLTIRKTHTGNFHQGQEGATFTITVDNIGNASTTDQVVVTDNLPLGFVPRTASGTGWTCAISGQSVRCTQSSALAAGQSFSPITLTVDVDPNAPANDINTVTVSGGNDQNDTNNEAQDPITVLPGPDLTISKNHSGDFSQGQQNATYTVTVQNIGGSATVGQVTVVETLPEGLTLVDATGTGWVCIPGSQAGGAACSRQDPLPPSQSYPVITVRVNVSQTAPSSVINRVRVEGGEDTDSSNNEATDTTTIVPSPDLTISKTHSANFAAGGQGVYSIAVSNIGTAPTAGAITVTDTVPAGLTPVSGTGDGWTCVVSAQIVTCNRTTPNPLAAGASFPAIVLTVNVAITPPPSVTNTVTVSGGGDTTPGNNTATDITTIGPGSDLIISKTHSGAFAQGTTGTYTLLVSNIGSVPSTGTVTVTDPLSPSMTLAAPPSGTGWTCNPSVPIQCQRSDPLNNGAAYPPILITVSILASTPSGAVANTATVGGGGDVNTTNNTSTDSVNIASGADLTVSKSHTGNFVQGQPGTFTVTVTNVGTAPTIGQVNLFDFVPSGLLPVSIAGPGWTCQMAATVYCIRSDSLAPGQSYPPITLTVQAGLVGSTRNLLQGLVHNDVEVRGGGDTNPSNNTARDSVTILPGPDLTITKTHSTPFQQGGSGTYTIIVSNVGGGPATGPIFVTDNIPSSLSVSSVTGPGWTCSTAGRAVDCTRSDSLAAGSSYPSITITVSISPTATGPVVNRATVAGGGDVNGGNNTATDTAEFGPNLRMNKSHSGTFSPGGTGTFLLSVTNSGGTATTGVVQVVDSVPAAFTPVSASGPGWSCSMAGQLITCTRSDALAPNAAYPSVTLTVNVASGATGAITNTATASGGGECPLFSGAGTSPCGPDNTGQDTVTPGGTPQPAGSLSCVASAVPPIVRREGLTELTGDILLTCTGGTPTPANSPVSKTNVQIFLNTNITSRLISGSSFSEALLMIDEPWPASGTQIPGVLPTPSGTGTQRMCALGQDILGTGDGASTYNGSTAGSCNMFQAQQAGVNSIIFAGVPIDPPGTGTRIIRITNIRANANQLGDSATLIPSQVVAFLSATPSTSLPLTTAQVVVGFVSQGLVVTTEDTVNFQQCVTSNLDPKAAVSKVKVTVKEGFATSFSRRTYAVGGSSEVSPTPSPQNIPGFQYHTETGFYNPAVSGNAGLSDFGSRIAIRFENLGAGVTLVVPTVINLRLSEGSLAVSGTLRLLNASGASGSPFAPAAATGTLDGVPSAQLEASGGVTTAVYEVLASSETHLELAAIPVGVSYTANATAKLPGAGTTSASGSFVPLSNVGTADSTSPVPRFTGASPSNPIFSIAPCACTLLFPFVSNQSGFDTGVSIANTSKDPFGTPLQAGPVTISYFGESEGGGAAPASQVSQLLDAGKTLTFSLSSGGGLGINATPGFQGYIIVKAEFQYCHGFAAISDVGANRVSESYLGLILDEAIPSRTVFASETLRK